MFKACFKGLFPFQNEPLPKWLFYFLSNSTICQFGREFERPGRISCHTCIRTIGKISTQPHTTFCIQFLDREDNDKNNTLPLGKQICFTVVWGCAEILPNHCSQPPIAKLLLLWVYISFQGWKSDTKAVQG